MVVPPSLITRQPLRPDSELAMAQPGRAGLTEPKKPARGTAITTALRVSLLASLLPLASCGEATSPAPLGADPAGPGAGGDRTGVPPGPPAVVSSAEASSAPPEYPDGPYGVGNPSPGAVIENLKLRGMVNLDGTQTASVTPTDITLNDFRNQGKTHLLITTATAWCSSCQQASKDLGTTLATRALDAIARGGVIINLLLDGSKARTAPTDGELTAWASSTELGVSLMAPADERTRNVFPSREWGYVIDLNSMQVVWSSEVPLYNDPTISKLGLDQLDAALNQGL